MSVITAHFTLTSTCYASEIANVKGRHTAYTLITRIALSTVGFTLNTSL